MRSAKVSKRMGRRIIPMATRSLPKNWERLDKVERAQKIRDLMEACQWGLFLLCAVLYLTCWWVALKAGIASSEMGILVLFHGFMLCRRTACRVNGYRRTAADRLMEVRREHSDPC